MKTLLLMAVLAGAPKVDQKLVGTWVLGGQPFVTLRADGSGSMEDGALGWSADGKNLSITDDEGSTDRATYQVEGGTLTLNLDGQVMTLNRADGGKAPAAPAPKPGKLAAQAARAAAGTGAALGAQSARNSQQYQQVDDGQYAPPARQAPQQPAQNAAGGNDQLARLLLSSAWCYFSYSQISGTTKTERYVYSPNGTWSSNANREMLSTGPNGSVYAGEQGGGGGRWQTRNNQLFMSEGDGPMQPLEFSLTQNSNGAPIINAGGREYSQCR